MGNARDGEQSTAELLRDAFRWFADGVEVRSAEDGEPELSPGATMMMSYLGDAPLSPSVLARRMRVSRQRVHVVVRELVSTGMALLEQNPLSGREKLIHVTSQGQLRRRRVIDALRSRDRRAARELGDSELAQLRDLLIRLNAVSPSDTV
ncbi:MarR family winged helix-turn-helix transcriptional regulator [Paramicrobacterium fandaimingii]|uniref:MarR family winged helix-turn-helix transcriptional regulator n=1 Tax=Paramicrobacterium fandaimingii TaxID=2708079 RepID=UPI0014216E37|nr:MarR family transcriptional regulator [Microbacterium fandaimingii]